MCKERRVNKSIYIYWTAAVHPAYMYHKDPGSGSLRLLIHASNIIERLLNHFM